MFRVRHRDVVVVVGGFLSVESEGAESNLSSSRSDNRKEMFFQKNCLGNCEVESSFVHNALTVRRGFTTRFRCVRNAFTGDLFTVRRRFSD